MATAAHAKKVYIKASSSAPSGTDECAGVTDVSYSQSIDLVDTTEFKNDNYRTRLATLIDTSVSMSGQVNTSDSPQSLIRSSFYAGSTVYVTVLRDGTNGWTFPALVESYEESGDVGDAVNFSASFKLNGTPTVRP